MLAPGSLSRQRPASHHPGGSRWTPRSHSASRSGPGVFFPRQAFEHRPQKIAGGIWISDRCEYAVRHSECVLHGTASLPTTRRNRLRSAQFGRRTPHELQQWFRERRFRNRGVRIRRCGASGAEDCGRVATTNTITPRRDEKFSFSRRCRSIRQLTL